MARLVKLGLWSMEAHWVWMLKGPWSIEEALGANVEMKSVVNGGGTLGVDGEMRLIVDEGGELDAEAGTEVLFTEGPIDISAVIL